VDSVQFPSEELKALENQALHGERARRVQDGEDWKWLQEFVFGAIFDEAIQVLRNAKTEEERMKAQQMFLAVEKPKRLLEFLVSQGDAARASLVEVTSTLATEEENKNA
jgi:hypothetical protein